MQYFSTPRVGFCYPECPFCHKMKLCDSSDLVRIVDYGQCLTFQCDKCGETFYSWLEPLPANDPNRFRVITNSRFMRLDINRDPEIKKQFDAEQNENGDRKIVIVRKLMEAYTRALVGANL